MATNVAQPLPYTPIQPIPEPIQRCPNLRLGLTRIALIVAATGLSAGAGATFCLGTMVFTVLTGAVVGGVVGLTLGVFFSCLIRFPTLLSSYRIGTLEQIERTVTGKRVLSAINQLKAFFSKPLQTFDQCYRNHWIHNELTLITEEIDRQRPDIVKVWKTFLKHLHGSVVFNPDGQKIQLDFSMELRFLEKGEKCKTETSWLNLDDPNVDRDLEALEDIQRVSFGAIGTFPKELMKKILRLDPLNRCVLVRGENREVLGFAWRVVTKEGVSIHGVARKPGAARLAIGDQLFPKLLATIPPTNKVYLMVRKSNPAILLYKKWGFEVSATFPNYYSGPAESAHRMLLNRAKFEDAQQRFNPLP